MFRLMATWGDAFTSSAKPIGRFARFAGHGGGANFERREFRERQTVRETLQQRDGFQLTTGGAYVTDETITSFKGYYRLAGKRRL